MRHRVAIAALTFAFISLSGPIFAQPPAAGRGGPPAPPKNLQVMPKDSARADVLTAMRTFTAGLGVECNYCHVQEGQGGRNDFALDEKTVKVTARAMMQMVAQVNQQIATAIPAKASAEVVKVQCVTCHRGKAIPENPPPPAPPAPR